MMFIKITPVFRRGASTPPETGAPQLLRADLIQRAAPVSFGGSDMQCVRLTLEGDETLDCTGTVNDLVRAMEGPAETFATPEQEAEIEPYCEPDTTIG